MDLSEWAEKVKENPLFEIEMEDVLEVMKSIVGQVPKTEIEDE